MAAGSTDYYELLGVAARRQSPTRSSGRTAGWPASCIPTPTRATPRPRRGSRRSPLAYETLSDPERRQRYDTFGPEGAAGGMPGRLRRRRPRRPVRRVLRRQPVRRRTGRRRGAANRGADLEAVVDLAASRRPCSARRRRSRCAPPSPATTARPPAPRPAPRRRPARTAAAAARCGGSASRSSARWSPPARARVRRPRHGTSRRRARRAAAKVGASSRVDLHRRRAGRRRRRVDAAAHRSGRGRSPRRPARRPLRARAGAAPRPVRAPGLRPGPRAAPADDPGGARRAPRRSRRSTAPRTSSIPRGTQTGRVFRLRGRGVPHVEGRGRGDLLVHVVVDTPTDLTDEQERAAARASPSRGARRSGRPTPASCRRSARRSAEAWPGRRLGPHVFVDDLGPSGARATTTATTSSGCCGSGRATR